jgi:hypothetical protein
MPGQPVHSSCQITPASTDRLAPTIATPIPAPQMVRTAVETVSIPSYRDASLAVAPPDYSPPPLFLVHSSFLI